MISVEAADGVAGEAEHLASGNRRRHRPDLAAANGGPATNLAAGSFPLSVAVGDFDGDPESAGDRDT